MTDKEIEREIQRVRDRLKSLAGEEHGGQSELARAIGVPRQRLGAGRDHDRELGREREVLRLVQQDAGRERHVAET